MVNIQQASSAKDRIVSTIKSRGPSLPIHIARALGIQPLFASAFLSELYGEQRIKISNIKVGSSPLYYIVGQEPFLENFIEHLNSKEREAFLLLKNEKFLDDELQLPAIRVALRALKDFAIPIKLKKDSREKVYWRYFQVPETEIISLIEKNSQPVLQTPIPQISQTAPTTRNEPKEIEKKEILQEKSINIEKENSKEIKEISKTQVETKEKEPEEKKIIKRKIKEEDLEFVNKIKDYLKKKDLGISNSLLEKKKEFISIISADSTFGKQEYLLFAKDKRKITEEELIIALQKASELKMQALILAPGEIDKKALEYAQTWRNVLKFEKVKL